jgi:RND family efflux transporter MFP subunit
VAGQLVDTRLLVNQTVRRGEVLAVLDAADFYQAERELRQARTAVTHAAALAERRHTLFIQGGISRKDLDQADFELAGAREDLRAAQRAVATLSGTGGGSSDADASGRATVRAPFAGMITRQLQFQGEFVPEDTPLFELADTSLFIVKANFPDTLASLLTEGSTATVEDDAFPGSPVTGRITLVGRTTDPASRTREVWVQVDAPGDQLRAGDAARVTATTRAEAVAVVVPVAAVQLEASNGTAGTVMVVDAESQAHATPVKTGLRAGDMLQIVEGLSGGETVVVEGNYALPDHTRVAVVPAAGEATAAAPAAAGTAAP